jgi:23S rRNA (adenine2503-C2)-methyltransferase
MHEDIKEFFEKYKVPKFRFKQLEDAIFKQFVSNFDEITNFPKELREDLKKHFEISTMFLVESHQSGNTVKFVLKTKDDQYVESVLMIHNDGRRTVCVSSQVFCAVGCTFCATGANQFKRSLTTDEIVEQVLFVSRYLKNTDEKVTNVVFMGMGEPFLAYNSVINAIKILNDSEKYNIGARHITVSTSGIVPRIYEYAELGIQTRLAISLHAPNDKLRSELMPINKRYDLDELMKACDFFTTKTNKRISYEYVLIKNTNDSIENAKELIELLKGRLAHVNLLIFNPHEFSKFEMPDKTTVLRFRDILQENGIEVSIRKSMGDDISGACGQLSGKVIREGDELDKIEV